MKTSSERLNGLDHLRALAIILVLMYHYRAFSHPDWIDTIGRFGWIGVDLFLYWAAFLYPVSYSITSKFSTISIWNHFTLNDFSGLFRLMLLPCFYISVFLSSGKEKHYPHYGNSSPLPKITNWTLLTKELFRMHGLCASRNNFT